MREREKERETESEREGKTEKGGGRERENGRGRIRSTIKKLSHTVHMNSELQT